MYTGVDTEKLTGYNKWLVHVVREKKPSQAFSLFTVATAIKRTLLRVCLCFTRYIWGTERCITTFLSRVVQTAGPLLYSNAKKWTLR